MHLPTLLPALLLATANASVFPRNGGPSNKGGSSGSSSGSSGSGAGKSGSSSSGSSSGSCGSVSEGCFKDVSSHHDRDSSFCGVSNSKKPCDLPSDLSKYSRGDVSSACDCLTPPSDISSVTATVSSQNLSAQCKSVSSGCFRDVSSHHSKDSSFCGVFNWKKSCDLPSDLSRYSRGDVSSACNCLTPPSSTPSSSHAPSSTQPSSTHPSSTHSSTHSSSTHPSSTHSSTHSSTDSSTHSSTHSSSTCHATATVTHSASAVTKDVHSYEDCLPLLHPLS